MSTYRDIDLQLTPAHLALKDEVHQFAEKVLRPVSITLDRIASPHEVIRPDSQLWNALRRAYEQRLHTMLIPASSGGLGLQGLSLHIAMEELGWGSADFAISLAVTGFPFASAALFGAPELAEELVTPFVADTAAQQVGCWAITEPDHGSDHFMVGTSQFRDAQIRGEVIARRDGDSFVLSGSKSAWVSNGSIATHAVVYLALDPSMGIAGGGVAFVPLNLPGVSGGEPLDKLGQRALNQGAISFDNVRIPRRYLLVEAPEYVAVLTQTLAVTNALMGAIFTGVARSAYEMALDFSRSRVQGGKPLSEHQIIQKQLFEMFSQVTTARALSRAAMVYNDGTRPPSLEHSIAAKVYCTQAALEVADKALQIFGGRGLSREYPIEKIYRDARASLIEDGTNEILSLVGAQALLSVS